MSARARAHSNTMRITISSKICTWAVIVHTDRQQEISEYNYINGDIPYTKYLIKVLKVLTIWRYSNPLTWRKNDEFEGSEAWKETREMNNIYKAIKQLLNCSN